VLKQFKDVYISDSSIVSIPDKLESKHKGLGGTNSKAAVKIQTVFSVISRTFKTIEILAATGNNSNKTVDLAAKILTMVLIIFDLLFIYKKSVYDTFAREPYGILPLTLCFFVPVRISSLQFFAL
jgi:hypothetical protein